MSKLDDTLKLVNKILKEIFKNNPDYTGGINMNFYMGGLTNIKKEESLKIKRT